MALILNDLAVSELAQYIGELEKGMSSHWTEALKEYSYKNGSFRGAVGADGHDPCTGFWHKLARYMLLIPFRQMGLRFDNFRGYKKITDSLVKRREGIIDVGMMRQLLTIAFLTHHLTINQIRSPIIIIGDGWGAMSSLILSCLPHVKVVVINLIPMLLVDLVYIRKAFPDTDIALVSDAEEYLTALGSDNMKVIAIRADQGSIIGKGPIGMAINIASMQEMNPDTISDYFEAFRNSSGDETLFYCCNRDEKVLPDGTIIRFDDYPWSADDDVLLDEYCPWHKFYFDIRPPFIRKYDGPIRHKLTVISKYI